MDRDAINESAFAALDEISKMLGVEFIDHAVASRSLGESERAVPGPWRETWAARLARVGPAVGLRIDPADRPPRALLRQAYPLTPLLGYAETAEGPRWIVVSKSRQGRAEIVEFGGPGGPSRRRVAVDELAEATGGDVVGWAMVQPEAPLDAMRADYARAAHPLPPEQLSRLIALLKPESQDINVIVAYTVGIAILSLATPLAVEGLVMTVTLGTAYQQLITISVMLFICLALAMLFRVLRVYVMEIIQRRLYVRIVSDVAYRLPRARAEAFDHHHGPELVNRFFEYDKIHKSISYLLLDALALLLQTLIGMVLLAFYHPYLAVFDLIILAAVIGIVYVSGRGAIRTAINESSAKYDTANWLEELARNRLAFSLDGGAGMARSQADKIARDWLRARRRHFRVLFNQIVNAHTLQVIAGTVMLALGGWLVIGGELTIGQLVASELVIALSISSLTYLAKHFEGFYDLMVAMEKLGYLTDLPLRQFDGEVVRVDEGRGAAIGIHGLSYAYEGHGAVLEGLDLAIGAGERVALIGPDGSGRSTLIDLLFGLREPTSGQILYDGTDLREVHPDQIRGQIAATRGVEVFQASVADNVRLGRDDMPIEQIREAVGLVGLLEELGDLPDGLNSMLVSGGHPLSEGQALRLTLARVIAHRPRLLLLDKTLDALEPGVRGRILDVVLGPGRPWTVVVVTHSRDVLERCDRTVALEAPHHDRAEAEAEGYGVEPIGGHDHHRPPYMKSRDDFPEIATGEKALPALRMVQSLGPIRRLGKVLGVILLLLPFAMAFVPWRQNVGGMGRVVAYSPLDRTQPIKAPISGRVMRWWVVEGSKVKQGDRILEMEDNDPDYLRRLELLLEAARERMRASDSRRRNYELVALELVEARQRAVETAEKQRDIAVQRVEIARQDLQAAEGRLRAAAPDYERKRRGAAEGLVSVQEFQFAERAYVEAQAAVDRALAEVAAATAEVAARSAELERVRAEAQSRIDAARADAGSAQNELAEAQQAVTVAEVDLQRQSRQLVLAPRDGTIFRILTGQDTDLVSMGTSVAILVPDYPDPMSRSVELWVSGRDMPLIEPGREVRLQFDGWPAVQFIGWPSVAIGTFPGRVTLVDPTNDGAGQFRILVAPPPGQADAWPSERFLRQGVQVRGWVLLRHVTLGYEIWRRINGFPPYVAMEAPGRAGSPLLGVPQ